MENVKHSLPGTNQAGKASSSGEKNDQENRPGGGEPHHQDQVEEQEHSLPGVNQAGKGAGSGEKTDGAAR